MLKNYRFVVTDVENKAVIDILRKRNKSVVIDYLSKLQGSDKVELVAMDMWRPYKDAVNIVIPHAKIVIDKFHVREADLAETVHFSLSVTSRLHKNEKGLPALQNILSLLVSNQSMVEGWKGC